MWYDVLDGILKKSQYVKTKKTVKKYGLKMELIIMYQYQPLIVNIPYKCKLVMGWDIEALSILS